MLVIEDASHLFHGLSCIWVEDQDAFVRLNREQAYTCSPLSLEHTDVTTRRVTYLYGFPVKVCPDAATWAKLLLLHDTGPVHTFDLKSETPRFLDDEWPSR